MEVEDFDDDDVGLTSAQMIARERAAFGKNGDLNSALRGVSSRRGADNDFRIPAAGVSRGQGGFGLDSELERDSRPANLPQPAEAFGLTSGMQRLDFKDARPQASEAFGLSAEVPPPPPPASAPSPSRATPPGPLTRGLQPLGGPGRALPPPRRGPGLSPLRPPGAPPPAPVSQQQPAQPPPPPQQAFGLAAEAAEDTPRIANPGNNQPLLQQHQQQQQQPPSHLMSPLPAPLPPSTQPPPPAAAAVAQSAFGLANELRPQQHLPEPGSMQQHPQYPQQQQPPGGGYGLGDEVRAAAAAGGLQRPPPPPPPAAAVTALPQQQQQRFNRPSGGYGLAEDVHVAGAGAAAVAPGGAWGQQLQQPGQQQQPGGGFGIAAEVGSGPQPPQPRAPGVQPQGYGQGYGLDNDIAQQQQQQEHQQQHQQEIQEMQQQQQQQQLLSGIPAEYWSQPPADTALPLDQLLGPAAAAAAGEGPWLQLNARQAQAVMTGLAQQGVAPRVVDIREAREKLLDASAPPRLAYLAAVERAAPGQRLGPNCRPSLLQTKLKAGQNRLRKLLEPVLEPGGQGFVDLSYSPEGALQPESARVWQFGLTLVQADGVGKTGLQRVRQPCLYIARVALFDRRANRFLGNVLGLRPSGVSQYDKRWNFNTEERVVVRCGCVQSDPQAGTRLVSDEALSLFVEFNVSYRLSVMDTLNMPQNEGKSAQLLDEINTCWAMISFRKCTGLQREVQISVPLYHGSIYNPQPMTAIYEEKRKQSPFLSAFKSHDSPVLQFRVGPLSEGKPPLVPYAFMPPTLLATPDLASALATYRMAAALLLARQPGPFAPAADPVLAGFPALLGDHHLLAEFLTRWRDVTQKMGAILDPGCCAPEVLPPLAALLEAFRRCTVELAPLAHCPTIPPRHINNFVEYQGHRLRLVQSYCHVVDPASNKILGARHPVEPLSHAGFEFLHAPFDVSEVRVCMADRLERPELFY
ncbi:hypothetical protein Agub_g6810, partial [Astrephomene gubernaculifera]